MTNSLNESLFFIKSTLYSFLPRLGLFVLIVVVGLTLAKFLSWVVAYIFNKFRLMFPKSRNSIKLLISSTIFWVTLIAFIYWALSILKLDFLNKWLDYLDTFIPQLLLALLIILFGYIFSKVIKITILQISAGQTIRLTADLLAIFIMTVSVIFALDQIQINSTIINHLFLIAFSILLAGIIVLLIMGSSNLIKEMMCAKFIADTYHPGQLITVNNVQGRIKAINNIAIHLQDGSQTIILPASMLINYPVTVVDDDVS